MKPFSYHDLLEAFPMDGCALCRLLEADAHRYLDLLLYEYAMDYDIHGAFRSSRGLCSLHGAQLVAFQMGATTIAALYEGVLMEALGVLDGLSETNEGGRRKLLGGRGASGKAAADALEPSAPCVCCASLSVKEADYIGVVLESLDEAVFRDAYTASDAFCLPHMTRILRRADADTARIILSTQRRVWANLRADINMFMAKQDPRFGVAPDEREATSWRRAVAQIAGRAGLFGLRGR
ncbi:MAG: DUF6062 family protein [Chloroflexota bacterium]|nr:DUF6062 family protein [Chloroflexota bacterium]